MSSNLLRVVQEQQETIEKQSRLIADLIATLESWEQTAGYDLSLIHISEPTRP